MPRINTGFGYVHSATKNGKLKCIIDNTNWICEMKRFLSIESELLVEEMIAYDLQLGDGSLDGEIIFQFRTVDWSKVIAIHNDMDETV